MANRVLLFGMVLYITSILFSIFQLPGTLELSIISLPTVAILSFRFFRAEILRERNLYIRYFLLIMSIFISLTLLLPIFFIVKNQHWQIEWMLFIGWVVLIVFNTLYYALYYLRSKVSTDKTGYFIILLICLVYLSGAIISYSLDTDFQNLKSITFLSLISLSVYLYFQFIHKKTLPNLEIGRTLFIGGVFIYLINLSYLFLL